MKSEEVVGKIESPRSEGEADGTDELSGGTPEASSLAELVEESPVGAKDEKKKKRGKKDSYLCRFCNKPFPTPQALGGHMNGHSHARTIEKMEQYQKLIQKYGSRLFTTLNPREHGLETSSYPISNYNQPGEGSYVVDNMTPMQPQQQMESPQAGYSKTFQVDSQQFNWPQASTNDFNSRGGPTKDFTNKPNLPNTCAASDATVNGNYETAFKVPSMSGLTSQYSVPAPSAMSDSNAQYDNCPPCACTSCLESLLGPTNEYG